MNSSPLKVLVVDDQDGIRFLLDIILKEEGHKVFMAKNGLQGLEKHREAKPDLIFMDIRMPIMDGIDAVKEIRKFDQQVTIVIMTAYSEKKAIDELGKCNIYEYISKPFDVTDIQRIVSTVTRKNAPKIQWG